MDTRTGMVLPEEQVPEGQKQYFAPIERDISAKERMESQIQLYAPCGCGSGKKFKFCHYRR